MINQQVAQALSTIADYLEMDPETNPFRIRAYRKAGLVIGNYPTPVDKLNLAELKALPGVGEAIAEKIHEYVTTGKIKYLEDLKKQIPVDIEGLTKISGIGPKTVKRLYFELGVKNVKDLERVAKAGKLAKLPGFGQRSQERILESLRFVILDENKRVRLDQALAVADEYLAYLKKEDPSIAKLTYAGSLRRRLETIGDIDLLVVSALPKRTIKVFVSYPQVVKVLGQGETKASVWLKDKIQVDLRVVKNSSFGSALQYFTGSKNHGIHLRKIAVSKGFKLNEYGLFLKAGLRYKKVAGQDEKEIYRLLVGRYIEPELREDVGEIELALSDKLPQLVELADIKGDLHTHTHFSDGVLAPEELIKAALARGYKYLGISDHLGHLAVAKAIEVNEFGQYLKTLKHLQTKYQGQIKILIGGEVNIKPSGKLDFPQRLLKKLDYVIASVHSSFYQDEKTATERMIYAINHPLVTIIGHPTGRLLGEREGLKFNAKKVFLAASDAQVAFEINAHPARLDLSWQLARLAKSYGVKFSINTDAHSAEDLDLIKYGVWQARKAGLEKEDLFFPNTSSNK